MGLLVTPRREAVGGTIQSNEKGRGAASPVAASGGFSLMVSVVNEYKRWYLFDAPDYPTGKANAWAWNGISCGAKAKSARNRQPTRGSGMSGGRRVGEAGAEDAAGDAL
jgi:hypothetical protein